MWSIVIFYPVENSVSYSRPILQLDTKVIRSDASFDMDISHFAVSQVIIDMKLRGRVTVHQILLPVDLPQITDRADRSATAFQGFAKCRTELSIKVSVDQRIESAVEVTHPEYHGHDDFSTLAGIAQGRDDVPVERKIFLSTMCMRNYLLILCILK